ncbi:hypothetical protein LJ737_08505 [Hymenobacter sp. 15J16-1T3B]|uniref:hypothetical protein n=1 Tax=Hymenobacter sp. 15J16-1T3B TaxID=2886941 RepID=UPI001D10FBBD|nr:hypothetical protein [Hymenobacter sp. 15J16-1T3B]MCC3157277.1 hypothetical protein [Hymenobacter sp. 15J16-1T3B]
MITAVFLFVVAMFLGWHWRASRRRIQPLLAEAFQAGAVVREYSMPNPLTPLSHPYVEYTAADGTVMVQRLEYPKRKEQELAIGQKVTVLGYRGHLYYSSALTKGKNADLFIALVLGIGALAKLLDAFFHFL